MNAFNALIETIQRLLGPEGCPWDREQTLSSMRSALLEETYEVMEAIDLDQNDHIAEELGDLLFLVVFLSKLAEQEKRFTLEEVLQRVVAKFIRRHPHVFQAGECQNAEEVMQQWEAIKHAENQTKNRHSILDGIPRHFPALARAQKMMKKLKKLPAVPVPHAPSAQTPEDLAGQQLWDLTAQIAAQNIQAEQALQKRLTEIEAACRSWETQRGPK